MVVKVYISGMSGNKEVKKRQQRVLMILDSKVVKYEVVDITEPGREPDKELMQDRATSKGGTISDPNPRHALPPQLFYDDEYCGDYDLFDMANECDTLDDFLKLAPEERSTPKVVQAVEEETVQVDVGKALEAEVKAEAEAEAEQNGSVKEDEEEQQTTTSNDIAAAPPVSSSANDDNADAIIETNGKTSSAKDTIEDDVADAQPLTASEALIASERDA